jgi:hypothetical protein
MYRTMHEDIEVEDGENLVVLTLRKPDALPYDVLVVATVNGAAGRSKPCASIWAAE